MMNKAYLNQEKKPESSPTYKLAKAALEAHIKLTQYTREEAVKRGLVLQTLDADIALLQEVADTTPDKTVQERALKTIEKIQWHNGRRFEFKEDPILDYAKVAA